jgi:hypothetical protein
MILKPIVDFYKSISSRDNHSHSCIICSKERGMEWYENNKEVAIEYAKNRRANNPERIKELNRKSYHNNKEERARQSKVFRSKNKELIAENNKKWREENKEYVKQKKKEYSQNNRHIQQAWVKKRKEEDPLFKMSIQIRVNFNNIFNKVLDNKLVKDRSSLDILCCSFEYFFNHIESQFLNWMSFENHGKCEEDTFDCTWHFDHIIPISYAKTEEEVYLLNHWSNFQPLCGKRNLIKNSKFFPCTNLELKITFCNKFCSLDNSTYICRIKITENG